MGAKRREATYEDLLRVPENLVAEIVEGELYANPRPASPHALAFTRLSGFLDRNFGGGGGDPAGWWILSEPELHLGRDVLVPDIDGWRRERMPVYPTVTAFELAPDWVCEILSPSTLRLDRVHKLPRYAHHQVRHAWLVEPAQHMLEVYRLESGHWSLMATYEGDAVIRAEPFETVELPLTLLWG